MKPVPFIRRFWNAAQPSLGRRVDELWSAIERTNRQRVARERQAIELLVEGVRQYARSRRSAA